MTIPWTTERNALRDALFTRLDVSSMDDVPAAAAAQADAVAEVAWKRYYALDARGRVYDAAVAEHGVTAAAAVAAFELLFPFWRDGGVSSAEDFGVGIVAASLRADTLARYVESIARAALVGTTSRPNLLKLPTGDTAVLAPGGPFALGVPSFIGPTWTEDQDRATALLPATLTLRTTGPDRDLLRFTAKPAGVRGSFLRAAVAASEVGGAGQVKITLSVGDYAEVFDRVDVRSDAYPALPDLRQSMLVERVVQVSTSVPTLGSNFAPSGWGGGYLAALEERLRIAKLIAAGGAAVPWRVPVDVGRALERATGAYFDMLARRPTHPRDRKTGPARTIRDAEDALGVEIAQSAECRAALVWPA